MFREEKVKTLPRELYLEPTNRCNSKCNICVRTFRKHERDRDLLFSEFEYIVDQFPILDRVVLHGIGEPLMNKDILRMIQKLKSANSKVLFNSNATLLNRDIQMGLIESGLDEYRVSLDSSSPGTYERMRGVPYYERVIENVRNLVELKKSLGRLYPKISLWFTGTRENIGELPDLLKIAAKINVDEVYLQRLTHINEGLANEENSFFEKTDKKILKIICDCERIAGENNISFFSSGAATPRDLLEKRVVESSPWQKCLRPWTLSYITANGNVLPCCISPFSTDRYSEIVLGNIFEERFIDIWNNDIYTSLRKRLLTTDPPQYCSGCGVKWSL